jgi:hypothetical protein
MSLGGGPDPDAFTLDEIGRSHGGRHGTTLERRAGEAWIVVARYADLTSAAHALDEAIAEGGSPTDYRLVTPENAGTQRLLLIGAILLAVVVAVSLWQIID